MNSLEELLFSSYSDLENKMVQCKTLHRKYNLTPEHRDFFVQQSVLSIYAAWEGFLRNSLEFYLQQLTRLQLDYAELSDTYLTYQTDKICNFSQSKSQYKSVKKLSVQLHQMYLNKVNFESKINLQSNASWKNTNSVLEKLNLKSIEQEYKIKLDKLLTFRNSIAHGENGIPVNQDNLDEFTILVQDLAVQVINAIIEGFNTQVYRK
ncbi:MAE_28990/MAE_18760 family HEPN-like nuclease [Spirulina sp. CCNP1310]|uniref:MAE_28990/MAE_18760 family HEPN-like nuclease n=1 Tax=Spirulina sp. CCNP1310 TaxID=3110249 RepID=UPI002B203089|nr:MAE_28990/MAE_18760 family HEPN-like nuclease [Spirulina sp. CCNP1310]MEA5418957.1 MAE_28990/MAE_18760 family HEPN-like nuclease [Spirulina sp. CCNP1310]